MEKKKFKFFSKFSAQKLTPFPLVYWKGPLVYNSAYIKQKHYSLMMDLLDSCSDLCWN